MCDFEEDDLVTAFRDAGFRTVELEMDESRMPVRGPEWVHGFRHGAPAGYSGYDMLLAAGISRQRADEFLAAGEHYLGETWTMMTCPVAYLRAVR